MPVAKFKGAGEPMLCVIGGGGAGCGPVSSVRERGVGVAAGGRKGTHLFGIVPDGVARVRFTPDGGTPKDSIVRENFYDIRVREHAPATPLRPPKGWLGRPTRTA